MKQIRGEAQRLRLLRIMDGRRELLHTIYHLNNFAHSTELCEWLLARGLKGENLVSWLKEKHDNSVINMVSFIVSEVNRAARKPVIAGVDYGRPEKIL